MAGAIFAVLVLVAITVTWVGAMLGKSVGDELATWVIGHEDDDSHIPEFGVEFEHANDGRLSLRAYRPYAARYRQLRRARGEDVRLARRFEFISMARFVVALVLPFVYLVIAALLGEMQFR